LKTKAVRLYGVLDLRLEEFELPPLKDDEILAKVVSDSICMSTYKAAIQGPNHKRVPHDIDRKPIIVGHEFCGEILQVGKKWRDKYKEGSKFAIQPALNEKSNPYASLGYSFQYIGGCATYIIIPNVVMEQNCLLNYEGVSYYHGSLAEPTSCIIAAFHSNYHTTAGSYVHSMGIKEGGNMAILAGAGPMGIGAIDYAIHCDRKPNLLIVTDIDQSRLDRAASIYTPEKAKKNGVNLIYVNTAAIEDPTAYLLSLTDGKGYDDVFVFAAVKPVVEQADAILGKDGCLNFFAGPTNTKFNANLNFYNVHYNSTHIVGTSGSNTNDMLESLQLMERGQIDPSSMITHIGGLNSAIETTLNLPNIPGGKKLIYTNIELDLTPLNELKEKGKTNKMFHELASILESNNGLWCTEAEKYLLKNAKQI